MIQLIYKNPYFLVFLKMKNTAEIWIWEFEIVQYFRNNFNCISKFVQYILLKSVIAVSRSNCIPTFWHNAKMGTYISKPLEYVINKKK